MPLWELALLDQTMTSQPKLTFNAYDLNAFYSHPGNRRSTFIPSLATGTMPINQGSAIAPITPEDAIVASNEVPSPTFTGGSMFGGSGSLPIVAPIQNQKVAPSAQAAPWVKISPCNAANFKKSPSLGLVSQNMAY
jgi:hypothetical protein